MSEGWQIHYTHMRHVSVSIGPVVVVVTSETISRVAHISSGGVHSSSSGRYVQYTRCPVINRYK